MIKIKEYINNKPRLKKTLRILAVIGVIFSVGFNILIIGVGSCSIHNSKEHDSNNIVEPLATTPIINKAFEFDNICTFGIDEVSNELSYNAMLNTFSELTESTFTSSNGTFISLDSNSLMFLCNFATPQSPAFGEVVGYDFSFKVSYHADDIWVLFYNPQISSGTRFYVAIQYYRRNVNNYKIYGCMAWQMASSVTDPSNIDVSYIETYFSRGVVYAISMYKDISLGVYGSYRNPLYGIYESIDVANSYNIGYSDGHNAGYNEGRLVGYNEGVASNSSDTSSVFGLISQSFTALTSLLNLQILPGITFAAIVFTPLIITIIIVIVKMFKG